MAEEKKIGAIKEELQAAEDSMLPDFIARYEKDERSGVKSLVEKAGKRIQKLEAEYARIENLKKYEKEYADAGYICGIDEVGRGPLAGPVVAGAVILPKDCDILYINDSKKLSASMREKLYDEIMEKAVATGIGMAGPGRIDEINILQATYEAMRQAITNLKVKPDILLNDAVTIPGVDIRQVPIIKGDAKSISIGAASIIAKNMRKLCRNMDLRITRVMAPQPILQQSKNMDQHQFTGEPLLRIFTVNNSKEIGDAEWSD